MLSAVLFAQDSVATRTIEHAARESGDVCIYKSMRRIPPPYELIRVLNCFQPDVVFVELADLYAALVAARSVHVICRGTAVIGFTETRNDEIERAQETEGLEVLTLPATVQGFRQALCRAILAARPATEQNLVAFLPAKAGSGATTIAINVAGRLAQDLDRRVLVIDADLRSGLISVLLKCSVEYSILNALDTANSLDGTLWNSIVVQTQGLDLLASPRTTESKMISWANYHRLLQFARQRYDSIVVDLPEVVNDATVEMVRRAGKVLVVTTPELPSLVLARQRRQELAERGITEDQIGFLLNRWTRSEVKVAHIEQFLDAPVTAVVQNDYHCVRRATQEGRLVGKKSELGRTFAALAARIASPPAVEPKPAPALQEALEVR